MSFDNEEEISKEREKWKLTDEEYNRNIGEIFNELVLTGNAKKSQNPTLIMIGGQAGCGKSMLVGRELKNLEDGAIIIDQDILRTKHPKYSQIHDTYTEREEFLLLKRYLDRVVENVIRKSSEERYNIILESALRSVSKFIGYIQRIKQDGDYSTKLSILATSPDVANLSMFKRFCTFLERDGECRRNTRIDNDSVNKIPQNIQRMDELGIFDDITISKRGNENNSYTPIQIYSKKEMPNVLPRELYIRETSKNKMSLEDFEEEYISLRKILEKYGQEVQIARLDEFRNQFCNRSKSEYPEFND